jgi:hypothetical protein
MEWLSRGFWKDISGSNNDKFNVGAVALKN